MEGDDGPLLPVLEPEVSRDQGVVTVGLAAAAPPVVELVAADADQGDQARKGQAGQGRVAFDEIDEELWK